MRPQPTTGQTLARGSAWITLGEIISALSGLAITVASARMLAPSSFGLLGVALLTISTLTALTRTGFDRALVQRADAESYLNVTFTVQLMRGALLAGTVFALGYPVSILYEEPELFNIFAAMSLGVLSGGFRNPATVFFQRELNFRIMVYYGSIKAICKMLTVLALLFTLQSVWALVVGHIAGTAMDSVFSHFIQKKRPKVEWNRTKARELYQFGKWLTGMSILGLVVTKGDDIFISKYLGLSALGLYSFAYEIANLPATNVTHVVGRVSFPTYARLYERGEMNELRQAFFNVMRGTVLVTAPLSVVIYINIDSVVTHVVGEKWQAIIPLVQILVAAGFIRSIAALAAALFQGTGRPHLDFYMNLPRFVLLLALIWPACAFWGLKGASFLTLIAVSSCLPTWLYGVRRITGITAVDLVRENALGMAATVVLSLCFLISRRICPPETLSAFILQVATAIGMFGSAMWLLGQLTSLRFFDEIRALSRALRKRPA